MTSYDETINIAAVGDIMLGDRPLMVGLGVRSSIEHSSLYDPFADVCEIFKKHDVVFGNLEAVISEHGKKERNFKSLQMRGPKKSISLLKNAGFNVLSIANNHIMQHGDGAFKETVDLIQENDILPIGCIDSDERPLPKYVKIKDTVIGFVGYSLRQEKFSCNKRYAHGDFRTLLHCVKEYKDNCDFLIVSLHWGDEYVSWPSREQIRQARLLADEGASLILGHHPHVIQGIESYNKSIIAYSLGNFVFDVWQKRLRQSCILSVKLRKNMQHEVSRIPVMIDQKFRPLILKGKDSLSLNKKYQELDKLIQDIPYFIIPQYDGYAQYVKLNEIRNKIENRALFVYNLRKYNNWVVKQSLLRFVEDRINK